MLSLNDLYVIKDFTKAPESIQKMFFLGRTKINVST